MKNKHWFITAALCCGFSVGLGAFGAHALREILDEHSLHTWETGIKYMMFHSLALFIVTFTLHLFPEEDYPRYAGWAFLIGIILFSGSLFLLATIGIRPLGIVTPVGGILQITGWIFLAMFGYKRFFSSE